MVSKIRALWVVALIVAFAFGTHNKNISNWVGLISAFGGVFIVYVAGSLIIDKIEQGQTKKSDRDKEGKNDYKEKDEMEIHLPHHQWAEA